MSTQLTMAGAVVHSIEPARARAKRAAPMSALPTVASAAALRADSRGSMACLEEAAPRSAQLAITGAATWLLIGAPAILGDVVARLFARRRWLLGALVALGGCFASI